MVRLIQQVQDEFPVRRLCKMVGIHPSSRYAWGVLPESKRAKEDKRLLGHIQQSRLESGAVYGYRKVSDV